MCTCNTHVSLIPVDIQGKSKGPREDVLALQCQEGEKELGDGGTFGAW